MDISKEYIDMVNYSEIQKQWKPENGDFYWNKYFKEIENVEDGEDDKPCPQGYYEAFDNC